MFKRILVPTDGSRLSMKAARYAARLAHSTSARITALHVIPPFRSPAYVDGLIAPLLNSPAEYKKSTERYARKLLAKVEAVAKAARVRCDTVFVTGEGPWRAIIANGARTALRPHLDVLPRARRHRRRGARQ